MLRGFALLPHTTPDMMSSNKRKFAESSTFAAQPPSAKQVGAYVCVIVA